ncbi:uncharacterized protein VTP21DRAFT_10748 [Calcarisporiella thermophila]|uniref:uncharacterized protein n=1 Tax=Calcarisporiella thermophila TaxID=911321 RepID=UPI0037440C28
MRPFYENDSHRRMTKVDQAMKFFVLVVNVLTSLAGLALVILGLVIYLRSDIALYSKTTPIALMILGAVVFVVSFMGCLGAMGELRSVLIIYFSLLLLLVLVQLFITILAFTPKIDDAIDAAWQKAYDSDSKLLRDIENEYSCCGLRNVTDRAVPKRAPDACVTSPYFGYDQPCYRQLRKAYKRNGEAIAIGGLVLAVVQILSLMCAGMLISRIPTPEEREREYLAEHERLVRDGRGLKPGDGYGTAGSTSQT